MKLVCGACAKNDKAWRWYEREGFVLSEGGKVEGSPMDGITVIEQHMTWKRGETGWMKRIAGARTRSSFDARNNPCDASPRRFARISCLSEFFMGRIVRHGRGCSCHDSSHRLGAGPACARGRYISGNTSVYCAWSASP